MTAAMALVLEPRARLEHRPSAAQLLLSELLVLPVADLEQRVTAELDANPALELPAMPACPHCGRPAWSGGCLPCARVDHGARQGFDQLALVAAPVSERDSLIVDAARSLRPGDRALAARLVAELDELGLLREPLPALADRLGVGFERLHRVIGALRASGAPGLAAESLAERLRLQVAADPGASPPVHALVALGLDALAHNGPDAAAAACGLRPDQVRAALAWIRAHLAAEPFGGDVCRAPLPVDAVVTAAGDRLLVEVVAGPWSALRVADSYRAVAADPLVHHDIVRASRFLDMIERRAHTMVRVLRAAVTHQSRRVLEGPSAHRPLLRRDLATELGLHESTVSRVVAGKHLLLPTGETVAFAALFGAARGVQQCLLELVAAETVARSDAELVIALAGQGHRLSRRTVAKYRAALGIPAKLAR